MPARSNGATTSEDVPAFPLERAKRVVKLLGDRLPSHLSDAEASEYCHQVVLRATSLGDSLSAIWSDLQLLDEGKRYEVLLSALAAEQYDVAEELLELSPAYAENALYVAIREGWSEAIKLIRRRALLYKASQSHTEEGETRKPTPVQVAIEHGRANCLPQLLPHHTVYRAPIEADGYHFTVPMLYAVRRGQIGCMNVLAKDSHSFQQYVPGIGNVLHVAVFFGQHGALYSLLTTHWKQTKRLVEVSVAGYTPLSLAAALGNTEAIYLLREVGAANPNRRGPEGRTPLHVAALNNHRNASELLWCKGADLTLADVYEQTPKNLAPSEHLKALFEEMRIRDRIEKDSPPNFLENPPTNIAATSGGSGEAYAGVARALEELGIRPGVMRFGGEDTGAVFAAYMASGCQAQTFRKEWVEAGLTEWVDHPFAKRNARELLKGAAGLAVKSYLQSPSAAALSLVRRTWNFTGLLPGDRLYDRFNARFGEEVGCENPTFGDLADRVREDPLRYAHLHVFATRLGPNPKIYQISSEGEQWKDLCMASGVLASFGSVPLFQPHTLCFRDKSGEVKPNPEYGSLARGGLASKRVGGFADQKQYLSASVSEAEKMCGVFNKGTMVLELRSSERDPVPKVHEITNVWELVRGLTSVRWNREQMRREMDPYEDHRKLNIDLKGRSTPEERFQAGREAIKKVFVSGSKYRPPSLEKLISGAPTVSPPKSQLTDVGDEVRHQIERIRSRKSRELVLRSTPLDPNFVKMLRKELAYHSDINEIHLERTGLTDAGLEGLVEVLSGWPSLRTVSLPENGITHKGISALGQLLTARSPVRTLKLWRNPLEAEGVSELAKALPNSPLESLDLMETFADSEGAQALAKGLSNNMRLQRLQLCGNAIGDGAIPDWCNTLRVNRALRVLDLRENAITDQGAALLQKSIPAESPLEHIYLSGNPTKRLIIDLIRRRHN